MAVRETPPIGRLIASHQSPSRLFYIFSLGENSIPSVLNSCDSCENGGGGHIPVADLPGLPRAGHKSRAHVSPPSLAAHFLPPVPIAPLCMHKINMPASAIRTAQGECKGAVAGKMSPHMYAPPQKLQIRLGANCSPFGAARLSLLHSLALYCTFSIILTWLNGCDGSFASGRCNFFLSLTQTMQSRLWKIKCPHCPGKRVSKFWVVQKILVLFNLANSLLTIKLRALRCRCMHSDYQLVIGIDDPDHV